MHKYFYYLIILTSIYFLLFFFPYSSLAAEVTGKALIISLDQTNVAQPTIISVYLDNNNPDRYMVNITTGYLVVKEVDSNNAVLYEGQVAKMRNEYYGNVVSPATHPPFHIVPQNPLTIHFPYFDEARKVRIFDEAGTQLLEIDLGQYGIGATPTAAPRLASCNKCGYCKSNTKQPGDLQQCMKCLYPDYVDKIDDTLAVDPIKNQPVQPLTGRYYSQIGCIDVGIAGFRDPTAAGGVLNIILSRLLFPITGVLSILSLIYGSFLLITAQDNPEQIDRGKKWIYGAIVGVVFTFGAILLIRIIGGDILKIPGLDI
ncbi:hypothetical protein KAZ66_01230 [Candidatus Woesebacteria bacterium]|nr:hypothetical protein [Candidatus Woesebacteria bacterium]